MYNGSSYDCFFTNNTCKGAGGGACYGGKHTLSRFVGNTTTVYGSAPGGAVADGVCNDCSFDWNYAMNYGGAVKGGYLTNCTFGVVQRGSILGAYLTECKCAYNCTFSNAVADVPLFESSTLNRCKIINCKTDVSKQNLARGSTFMNCLFLNNKMTGGNQAVMGYNCSYYNCTFVSNRYASSASAIRTGCKAVNCIFAGGYPCDLNLNDVPTLTNCIVTSFNTGTEFPVACANCLYVSAARADHLFADPGAGDCHLRPGSAAKAWGLMTPDYLAKIGDLDLDGNPRLTHKGAEPALDLGCYMYTPLGLMLLVR